MKSFVATDFDRRPYHNDADAAKSWLTNDRNAVPRRRLNVVDIGEVFAGLCRQATEVFGRVDLHEALNLAFASQREGPECKQTADVIHFCAPIPMPALRPGMARLASVDELLYPANENRHPLRLHTTEMGLVDSFDELGRNRLTGAPIF